MVWDSRSSLLCRLEFGEFIENFGIGSEDMREVARNGLNWIGQLTGRKRERDREYNNFDFPFGSVNLMHQDVIH